MADSTAFETSFGGGQFAPEYTGQFSPESGGQLSPDSGGQLHRNFHFAKMADKKHKIVFRHKT